MDFKLRIRLGFALMVAYDLKGFVTLVRDEMGVELAEVVSVPKEAKEEEDAREGVVLAFIRWCRDKGRMTDLARVAAQDRPDDPDLQAVRAEFDAHSMQFARWVQAENVGANLGQTATTSVTHPVVDSVRYVIFDLIKTAQKEFDRTVRGSMDPVVWQGATNKWIQSTCQALKQYKQLNGGELPTEFPALWVR